MSILATSLLPLSVGLLAATGLRAQFAEGFDSQATADVTVLSQPDSIVTFVDYSNMTVGSQSACRCNADHVLGALPPVV